MGSATGAGIAEISNQMEYDDDVAFQAIRKIYDYGRGKYDRPFCLTVSFTHPHDPYVARKQYWDLYEDCDQLMPHVPAKAYEEHDPHSKRIFDANDWRSFDIGEADIRRSRRAYFANISYLDDKIGEILHALETMHLADDTTILFVSDHGDMLGERGLWFKMTFFEGSSRVPLMVADRDFVPSRITAPVSTLDVLPTLCDIAGIDMSEIMPWTDGESLVPLSRGEERTSPVLMEYAAEASDAPLVGIREGDWKYIHCELDPPQLFDLAEDPYELTNLADDPAYADAGARFADAVRARWDVAAFDAEVRQSQARRWIVYEALRNGAYFPWDYQPLQKASERYMRNHMDLNEVEEGQRYPRGE